MVYNSPSAITLSLCHHRLWFHYKSSHSIWQEVPTLWIYDKPEIGHCSDKVKWKLQVGPDICLRNSRTTNIKKHVQKLPPGCIKIARREGGWGENCFPIPFSYIPIPPCTSLSIKKAVHKGNMWPLFADGDAYTCTYAAHCTAPDSQGDWKGVLNKVQ